MDDFALSNVIEIDWLPTYERIRDLIGNQLIELNCSIFLVERIESFPFNLFLPDRQDRIFWQLTKNALLEKCIMTIWRISADDTSPSPLNITYFHNELFKHIIEKTAEMQLKETLKSIDYNSKVKKVNALIKKLRNKYLGHLDTGTLLNVTPSSNERLEISLKEIKELLVIIQEQFDALCFNHRYSLWYVGYAESRRENQQTDIDLLLDSVARRSPLLNMPEKQPSVWLVAKSDYSEKEITILNTYRRKFGLRNI